MRENDFVARIGGDEFIVILDIDAQKPLEDAVSRIEHNVREFNSHHKRPYSISFSYGYGVFNARSESELHHFFRRIDRYMYENKSLKREAAI